MKLSGGALATALEALGSRPSHTVHPLLSLVLVFSGVLLLFTLKLTFT